MRSEVRNFSDFLPETAFKIRSLHLPRAPFFDKGVAISPQMLVSCLI